jgi:quercetin dioxygenase-like cupin family protein
MTTLVGRFVGPGEGAALTNPVGGQVVCKASDEDTADAYALFENTMPPRSPGPLPHIHRRHDEAFYVLDGALVVRVGTQTIAAPAGSFVFVPRGTVHQPANPGEQEARFILIFSPGGMGRFFADAAAGRVPIQRPSADPAAVAALEAFSARYDFELAELPEPQPSAE